MIKIKNQKSKIKNRKRKLCPFPFALFPSSESGQTLIEAVVALSALMVSLAGIAIAVIYAVNNTTFVKNQNLANKYAQQGIEYFKNKAANGETITVQNVTYDFRNLDATYCFNENYVLTPPAAECTANVGGYFKRSVVFNKDNCGGNAFSGNEVTITVSWPSSKCPSSNTYCHKAQLHSCFGQGANTSL